jgi:hypothetical protein
LVALTSVQSIGVQQFCRTQIRRAVLPACPPQLQGLNVTISRFTAETERKISGSVYRVFPLAAEV